MEGYNEVTKELSIVQFELKRVDTLDMGCDLAEQKLVALLEHPAALGVFSSKTIQKINMKRRSVSEVQGNLQGLKDRIVSGNSETDREIEEIKGFVNETLRFSDSLWNELPKYRPGLFAFLFCPKGVISFYLTSLKFEVQRCLRCLKEIRHRLILLPLRFRNWLKRKRLDRLIKRVDRLENRVRRAKQD